MISLILLIACAPEMTDTAQDTADPTLRAELQFTIPVEQPELLGTPVIGFDHDPDQYEGVMQAICTSYDGQSFPHCYDGHDGSDFMLSGGFDAMDAGSATIIAALDGEVVSTEDGHYDR